MPTKTLKLMGIAHGGAAIAKGKQSRTIFVPFGIPDEMVKIEIVQEKNSHSWAKLVEVVRPSPDRVTPPCPHFGVCGGCHFQHIAYARQLELKTAVVKDQLQRIGGFKNVTVHPTLPNPEPYAYRTEIELSSAGDGRLGFWSPYLRQVIPISQCDIAKPGLIDLLGDIELDLPGLRKLTLKIGEDGSTLAALEVDDVEPPELTADFPVSVSIVLPDRTAATLVGELYLVQEINGRSFRISPGCYTPPSIGGMEAVIRTVLKMARLNGTERVLDLYSGVGILSAALAEKAATLHCIELNPDAVADAVVNLDHTDNVTLYQERVAGLAHLDIGADVIVMHPPSRGMNSEALTAVVQKKSPRLITVGSDIAILARDGKQLKRGGYQLVEVQPIDMMPQNFQVEVVMLWQRR